jgi:RNA polymerase sigma-70 factor (ECF subfamily)
MPVSLSTALAELFDHHAGAVFGYLLRLSGDQALADDLTAETFYQALLAVDGFRGESSVKTWLLRIARNLFLRRVERDRRFQSLDDLDDAGRPFPDPAPGPETALIHKQHHQAVEQALLALPEPDRSLILLAAVEDLPQREIALILGLTVAAVKVRLFRARQRLAAAMEAIQSPSVPNPTSDAP